MKKRILLLLVSIFSLVLISEDDITNLINEALENHEEVVEIVEEVKPIDKFMAMSKEELDLYVKIYLKKDNEDEIYRIAKSYAIQNYLETAYSVAKMSNSTRNIYLQAVTSRLIGEHKRAINAYSNVLSVNPNDANSLLGIAISYKANDDIMQATGYLNRYLELINDSNARILLNEWTR